MPKLLELGLAENRISKLPVMNLPSVKKIVLSKNELTDISVLNTSEVKSLEVLEVESNALEEIPELNLK